MKSRDPRPAAGRVGLSGWLLLGLLLPLPGSGEAPATAEIRVGVAALVGQAPAAGELTQVLRARLAARPGIVVLDPAPAGQTLGAEPAAEVVRRLGYEHDLDGLVVGRLVEAPAAAGEAGPGPGRVELVLRSAHSGGEASRHEALLRSAADLPRAAERLAAELAVQLGAAPVPGAATATPAGEDGRAEAAFGLATGAGEPLPIDIESEELEFFSLEDEGRRLLFRRDVRVRRGDVQLRADELEAWYPPRESQPERLVARGDVRVEQGERIARCEEAVFLRSSQSLRCRGRAVLVFGCDVVRGETIEFDLAADRARVIGAASVSIRPDSGGDGSPCPAEPR